MSRQLLSMDKATCRVFDAHADSPVWCYHLIVSMLEEPKVDFTAENLYESESLPGPTIAAPT